MLKALHDDHESDWMYTWSVAGDEKRASPAAVLTSAAEHIPGAAGPVGTTSAHGIGITLGSAHPYGISLVTTCCCGLIPAGN